MHICIKFGTGKIVSYIGDDLPGFGPFRVVGVIVSDPKTPPTYLCREIKHGTLVPFNERELVGDPDYQCYPI